MTCQTVDQLPRLAVCQQARSATEQGELNAGISKNIVEVDESPLPPVEVDDQDERLDYEVVISRTNEEAAINTQISADKFNGISRYEQREDSESRKAFKEIVTFQMLLNKFQYQQDREKHIQESYWRCLFFMFCWKKGLRLPSIDSCPACQRYGSTHGLVGGKLNQHFILTGIADVAIRTKVLANREFCLSLWDPGGL